MELETLAGRRFDCVIQCLVVLSIFLFVVETLPEVDRFATWFTWSERIIVGIFTVEYVIRVYFQRSRYALSFIGIIDMLAIMPFYLSLGIIDARALRVFRFFRILRLAKLNRFGKAWDRLGRAVIEIKDELIVYFGFTMMLIFLASVGIYYCEHDTQPEAFSSIFHSMWWAVATLSTVGYGDVYPVTIAGRIFTFIILMLGLSIVSVPSGLLAAALSSSADRERDT